MDPEFINALPEDMRQEVVSQYIRDQRRALQPNLPDDINSEFLNALPQEIRDEVIEFERIETERRSRNQAAVHPDNTVIQAVISDNVTTVRSRKIMDSVQLIDKSGLLCIMYIISHMNHSIILIY